MEPLLSLSSEIRVVVGSVSRSSYIKDRCEIQASFNLISGNLAESIFSYTATVKLISSPGYQL